MKIAEHLPKIIIAVVLLGGGAAVVSKISGPPAGTVTVDVKVPQLSPEAARGKMTFDINCAACHGDNGSGSDTGPPLIHNIYNPGHHDDASFLRAAKAGVPAHHWPFGNMPPQPQIKVSQVADIIKYVREVQMANGIFYQQHKMN